MSDPKRDIKKVAKLIAGSENIFIVTGAGISADSGLPTYRGIGGLYNDKITEDGIPIETALAGETLLTNPEITWKYLSRIESKLRPAVFNQAHIILALMEKHFKKLLILTQNIDGFHQAAGSGNVIDIHGDLYDIICSNCGYNKRIEDFSEIDIPPHCLNCGKIMRPNVVLFGEMLPEEKLNRLTKELFSGFDLYLTIGTTSVFPYIKYPIYQARGHNIPTIEINPSPTEISGIVDIKVPMKAEEALIIIWDEVLKIKAQNEIYS